jgi:hypothetical protein
MNVRLVGWLAADPEVRGVQRLLEPDGPERFVKDLRRLVSMHGPVTLTALKQRPGQRALIRIDVEDEDPPSRFYAKLLRRSREGSEKRLSVLKRISDGAASVGVHVPTPVAYVHRFRALVFESAKGYSLLPCCAPVEISYNGEAEATVDRSRLFYALGEAVASLHLRLPCLGPVEGRDFEYWQVDRARSRLVDSRRDLCERFDALVRRWSEAKLPAPPDTQSELVALHGDLYPAQVLADAAPESGEIQLAILDWDAFCTGDAERDLGNLEAHLILERIRKHLEAQEVTTLISSLEQGYRSNREFDPNRLDWYRRGTILRLAALYADPSFGPHPPNPPALAESLLQAGSGDRPQDD